MSRNFSKDYIYNYDNNYDYTRIIKSIDNEYDTIYHIFEKIFSKSNISNISIDILICKYNYANNIYNEINKYKIENYINEINKKIYNELIIKLCNLYKINLDINIKNIDVSNNDIITINNDNFEILYETNNLSKVNIFKLDNILLNELNYSNILNIKFTISNQGNIESKMQEYIQKKLNEDILKKCTFKIIS